MKQIRENYKKSIAQIIPRLQKAKLEDETIYTNWLAQTYFFVRRSTRLLALAAALIPVENSRLHSRFLEHTGEEKNHDLLLLKDLSHFQIGKEDLVEYSATSAFYMTQFYLIDYTSPISFFGYILLLEGIAAEYGDTAYERIKNRFGDGPTAFLKVHGAADKEHIESAMTELELLPENEQELVMSNLKLSANLYSQILQDCHKLTSLKTVRTLGKTG